MGAKKLEESGCRHGLLEGCCALCKNKDGRPVHERVTNQRLEGVRRMVAGEKPSDVAKALGTTLNTVGYWYALYLDGGWENLVTFKRGPGSH